MNGLLMAKINNINLNIVLLNNDGGGIFSYLPQKASAEAYFERLFGTPTGLNFEYTHYFMILHSNDLILWQISLKKSYHM